jgi:hypothetical protein
MTMSRRAIGSSADLITILITANKEVSLCRLTSVHFVTF